jgi:hypothetical protein
MAGADPLFLAACDETILTPLPIERRVSSCRKRAAARVCELRRSSRPSI